MAKRQVRTPNSGLLHFQSASRFELVDEQALVHLLQLEVLRMEHLLDKDLSRLTEGVCTIGDKFVLAHGALTRRQAAERMLK